MFSQGTFFSAVRHFRALIASFCRHRYIYGTWFAHGNQSLRQLTILLLYFCRHLRHVMA